MPANPLDILRARPGIAGWIAISDETIRRELYFTPDRVESERHCEVSGGQVTVFKDTGDRRGRATFDIAPAREASFESDVDQALYQAGLGGEPTYPIAGKGEYYKVLLLDPEARDNDAFMANRARSDILTALSAVKGVRLAAAEFFLSKTKTSVVTSEGAAAGNDMSSYLVDLVFLAGEGAREQERHTTIARRRYQDLALPELVAAEAQRALDRLIAGPPAPGAVPVILGPDTLGGFIDYLVGAASARSIYLKQSPLQIGQPISPVAVKGEPLIIEVNALFPFGPRSYRIDRNGIAGRNVRLIDANVFTTPHADMQYAHYLNLPAATGVPGTPQLPPGRTPEADLRSGDYVEVIQFSDLIPSQQTGRFSAEIRFGYQVSGGRRRPITGGTLSGGIRDAFSHVRFSKEVALHDDYVGPNIARFDDGLMVTA